MRAGSAVTRRLPALSFRGGGRLRRAVARQAGSCRGRPDTARSRRGRSPPRAAWSASAGATAASRSRPRL